MYLRTEMSSKSLKAWLTKMEAVYINCVCKLQRDACIFFFNFILT